MTIIGCGGRDYRDWGRVCCILDWLHSQSPIARVVQGGASGADMLVAGWAIFRGIPVWACLADWDTDGKAAGPIRNAWMLEFRPQAVVTFPGGRGTANMRRLAMKAGVPIIQG